MIRIVFLISLVIASISATAQKDSFDVFHYIVPEFFTRSMLPSQIQWSLKNNDTSFCIISLYKSQAAKATILKDVMAQWNEFVIKKLNKASKKPGKIMTEQFWDGWASTLAIGNFYQGKKKCVVMLSSFRKDSETACVVYATSDRIFNRVIEGFSKNLHLKKE